MTAWIVSRSANASDKPLETRRCPRQRHRACRARRRQTDGSGRRERESSLPGTDSRCAAEKARRRRRPAPYRIRRAKRLTSDHHGDQRRRTRGLDRHARSVQIQLVRYAGTEKILVVAQHDLIAADRVNERLIGAGSASADTCSCSRRRRRRRSSAMPCARIRRVRVPPTRIPERCAAEGR